MGLLLGSFALWINGNSPAAISAGLVLCLLGADLIVLAHELGHAAVGIFRTEGLVTVRVGRSPALWKPRFGRLQLALNPVPAFKGPDGLARIYAGLDRRSTLLLALAGPVAGSLVSALLVLYGVRYRVQPLLFVGGVGGVINLINLVPYTHHGFVSDGAKLLDAIRGRGRGAPADRSLDAYGRWLVLFADIRKVLTPEHLRQLGSAPTTVGCRSDDQSETAIGLWRLACAGWCWREAERADLSAIRNEVLDERQAAARREVRRDEIAVAAARELAVSRKDDPDLNQAFARVRQHFSHPPARDDQERFAFRLGVALHDVERIAG